MLNNTHYRAPQATGASHADAVSRPAGFKHVAAVFFALCATIALVAGLAFSAGTANKAEAQTCTITNPQTFNGTVSQPAPTGTNPSHQIGLTFPTAAYVSEVSVTSKVKLGNETYGKWSITIGGQTFTSGSGVTVTYPASSTGTVTFKFDKPVKVGANSQGNANITLFGQSGGATNYSMTYKGSVNDPCPAPSPTTAPSTPTSATPTSTSTKPSTSSTPTSPTSGASSTSTTAPSSSNATSQPTTTSPAASVNPNAGTGERPGDATKPQGNWIGIRVTARAFDRPWEHNPGNINSQFSPQTNDYRYTKGIRFRLYTAIGGISVSAAQDAGPQQALTDSWATCVTGDTGECVIYLPASVADSGYFFVVQENEYPGTFHASEINWGQYGNFNNRTNAQLPGFVNLKTQTQLWGSTISMDQMPGIAPEIRTFGSSIQSLNNPPLEQVRRCQASNGPKIALVLDRTASIRAVSGAEDKYKKAVYSGPGNLLDSLQGTGASVAFFSFADSSPASGSNYPQLVPVDQNMSLAKQNAAAALASTGTVTNWERGLTAAKDAGIKYDEIIFVTDGDANHWGSSNVGVNVDGSVRGVEAAIYRANEIKEQGTRIVSIGVGQAESASHWKGSGQMKAISGPTYGEDYFGTDWDRLASTLRATASQVLCQLEVQVDKAIVDASGNRVADQSAADGWKMSVNVDSIKSNVESPLAGGTDALNPVYPATLSGVGGVRRPSAGSIQDQQSTPNSSWLVTFYGDNGVDSTGKRIPNSATVALSEDVTSKPGYEFVGGSGTAGNYRGSWYEVIDIVSNQTVKTGLLTGPQINVGDQPQGRRVVVHMANRFVPEINLLKNLPDGRKKETDQFKLDISKVTGAQNGVYTEAPLGSATTQGAEKGLQKTADGKPLQAGPIKLEPNTTYLLRENGASNANLADYDTNLTCQGATAVPVADANRSGSGRVWQVQTGATPSQNISCTFVNKPVLSSSISWKKVDNENKSLSCSQWQLTRTKDEKGAAVNGQAWVVNDKATNSNCSYANSGLQSKDDVDANGGAFKVSDLPLGTYTIEEVRAPNGYSVNKDHYKAEIVLDAANATNGVTVKDPFINYPDITTPGTLPRTGGSGVGLPAGIAAMIIALGYAMLRRQRA